MKPSRAISQVRRGALCAGCGGCALAAPGKIAMEVSGDGYLRPRQLAEITPAEEQTIAQTCPGLVQEIEPAGREDNLLWGPYIAMYTGWAHEAHMRFAGSSGAALTAVLAHLLETGEVDGVLQVRADPERPVGNIVSVSRTSQEVLMAAGSRYAPSAPLAEMVDLLDGEERFAFVGKPCDVAALRALAQKDQRIDQRFPIMLSFYCGGVPSLQGADQVVRALGKDPEQIATFRYRGQGWPGRATATDPDGDAASMTYNESWGKILSRHVQHRCKICADGAGAAADIVCADAWETDDRGYPLFEEQDGVSLVVSRTDLGEKVVRSAEAAGTLALEDFDVAALTAIQRGQVWRRRGLWPRLLALKLLGKPVPRYVGLQVREVMSLSSPKERARNFLGTVKRVLMGRVGERNDPGA